VAGEDVEAVYTIEATQNYWLELVHPLQRAGASVYLVSPSKSTALRTFYRRHTKNDAIDAEALSRLPVVDPQLRPAFSSAPKWDMLAAAGAAVLAAQGPDGQSQATDHGPGADGLPGLRDGCSGIATAAPRCCSAGATWIRPGRDDWDAVA
jgi:hypothetical protein